MNQVFISLDIEMTSPRAENQEILEIAAVKFKGRRVLETWTTLINPQCAIPYNIEVLTGIKQSDVETAPVFSEVAGDLVKFLGTFPLVAHTVSSDINCLERKGLHLSNTPIDTFELASILLPHLTNYSLASLSQHFNLPARHQHRALDDTLTTKDLFWALIDRAMELDLSIIQEINRLTAFIDWPLGMVFREIEREKAMTAFTGSSIRSRLAAKSGVENAALDVLFASRPTRETLTPNEEKALIDTVELSGLLERGGAIAESLSGYEARPQQLEMMNAVTGALNDSESLIVEAGTGVGKSLAYLLPAVYFAARNNEHVVVSTNTINLQDQLFNKDIPDLQRALPIEFKAALVKGRSNYLCQRRWVALRRHHDLNKGELLTLVKIMVWLPSTTTGDVAELNLTEEQRGVWSKLYAQAESCLGNQCIHFRKGSCFLFRARQTAGASHIIVVNHSLLLSDLVSSSRILPEYNYLIVDEAHHFEDEATHQLGFAVSDRDVHALFDGLSQHSPQERRLGLLYDLRTRLQVAKVPKSQMDEVDRWIGEIESALDLARVSASEFFVALLAFTQEHKAESRGYEAKMRLTPAQLAQPDWSSVEVAWDRLSLDLVKVEDGLSKLLAAVGRVEAEGPEYEATISELTARLFSSQEMRGHVNSAVTNPEPNQVYWITLAPNNGPVSLNGAPLHVGPILEKMLFSAKESVVMTSATLSTAGQFDYVRERLGLNEANEVLLGSPFDFAKAAMVYVPTDVPEPDRPDYQRHLQSAIIGLVTATKGRALLLFTSHSHLRQTYHAIKEPLRQQGILAVAHGVDGSARQVLQTFKTNPKTVLLGTSSFWEGVDVVGDALSVLVIARLPFAVPTDPIVAARSEQFEQPFSQYSVPNSILRFKQGFGRLIRSKNDRGIVVILDRRVVTRSYGRLFLQSLPQCTFRQGLARDLPGEAVRWLNRPVNGENGQAANDGMPPGVRRGYWGRSASENPK